MSTPYGGPPVLELLPAKARRAVYIVYGLIALVDGATLVGYASIGYEIPPWLIVATAVIAFLATPVQALAATNVTPDRR